MAGEERAVKVQIQNIKMAFNGRKGEMVALNGVDLDIHENEFVTVVGPSGCGKSTLLNIIAGLLKPTSGTVLCDGEAVEGVGRERGVVFVAASGRQYANIYNALYPRSEDCHIISDNGSVNGHGREITETFMMPPEAVTAVLERARELELSLIHI
mgnify:CR=1 FL=1